MCVCAPVCSALWPHALDSFNAPVLASCEQVFNQDGPAAVHPEALEAAREAFMSRPPVGQHADSWLQLKDLLTKVLAWAWGMVGHTKLHTRHRMAVSCRIRWALWLPGSACPCCKGGSSSGYWAAR